MFETLFSPWVFFSLLIALPLLPLLIHLINLMRHRRVKWAAMDFLLQSYKRHRTSVWLKQFLLLLMRMAAVALLVVMLGQAGCQSTWSALLGGRATHHYVLLDDSYSMSDRAGGSSAFDDAKSFLKQLGLQVSQQDSQQKFTLIRFSRASSAAAESNGSSKEKPQSSDSKPPGVETKAPDEKSAGAAAPDQIADLNAEIVTTDFDLLLEEKTRSMHPSELAIGPEGAMALTRQLVRQNDKDRQIVYIVSDYREKEWGSPAELRSQFEEIVGADAEIRMVNCVRTERPNLAITEFTPSDETRAAGVPLFLTVKVKNFGTAPARKVQVKVRSRFYDPEKAQLSRPDRLKSEDVDLPTVLIDQIRQGETVSQRVQVFFSRPGRHVVEAALADDAVSIDNHRWCVIDLPEGERVLLIDGSVEKRHAYFMQSAFSPSPSATTGVLPEVNTAAFLRDAEPQSLEKYDSIFLLDVGRLDGRAVANLERYVQNGGGLAIFVGDQVSQSFYNEHLYKEGQGLMPLPLGVDDLLPAETENTPDIDITDHPVFRVALGERNPLIRLVSVDRYWKPKDDWKVDPKSTVEVIARLRNQSPLVVEKKYYDGKVLAFLTTAAPLWNNWSKNPSFVVMALRLQSYLASGRRSIEDRRAGDPLRLQLNANQYLPQVSFVTPGGESAAREVVDRVATRPKQDSPLLNVNLGASAAGGLNAGGGMETARSGVYEAWLKTTGNDVEVRRFGLNVEPNEGDLALVDSRTLLASFDSLRPEYSYADEWTEGQAGQSFGGGANRLVSFIVLCVLACLLLGEQLMAYAASYHPARS